MSLIGMLPEILAEAKRRYEYALKAAAENLKAPCVMTVGEASEISGTVIQCDNAAFLAAHIANGSSAACFDLIYCDPPFFTRGGFDASIKIVSEDGEEYRFRVGAYDDYSAVAMSDYLTELAFRIMLMRDVLSDTGSIFIHLDRHAVHATKLLMDEIFGDENFVNEIIWNYKSGGSTDKRFAHKHDTILFYSRTKKYKFNPTKEKSYNRKLKKYSFSGVEEFRDELGWYTLVNTKDVWQIDMLGRSSGERLHYATQKPVALVKRIIEACSDEGDLCADFFSGSGTLAEASFLLKRRFVCVDTGSLAVENTVKRLLKSGANFVFRRDSNYVNPQAGKALSIEAERIGDCVYLKDYRTDVNSLPVRIKEKKRAEELLSKESVAFVDFWCVGYFDDDNCFHPEVTVTEGKSADAPHGDAVLVFDIFGGTAVCRI
ncbi:MAG: DNA-methyltransferase [Anaerovoracaceae bacterium]